MNLSTEKLIRYLWIAFGSFIGFLLFLILLVRVNPFGLFGELPALKILENPKTDESSLLISADGEVLGSYYREKRTAVEFHDLPDHLVNALISTEDIRFEQHSGIDMKGTFAIFYYLIQGKKRGSSTIPQQIAKNLYHLRDYEKYQGPLSDNMLVTKIKEWMVAIQIEKRYTKKEIITMYFNTVWFGRNTYGIKSAAETYFNTSPKNLTVDQAALLVGILKGPSFYDPLRNKERAIRRRNTVLALMQENGVLELQDRVKFAKQDLNLNFRAEGELTGLAPYLRNYLKPILQKWTKEHNYDLYGDGLKIFTTVNAKMQSYAEKAVVTHLKDLQEHFNRQWKTSEPWEDKGFIKKLAQKTDRYKQLKSQGLSEKEIMKSLSQKESMTIFSWNGDKTENISPLDSIKYFVKFLHTGLLSVEPHTGHIKAYVGDINFRYFKYDNVYQSRRQPGSAFKPFIYAYAIEEKGFTPCSQVLDVEVAYPWGGGVWKPKNSNGKYSNAAVSLKHGLANSINSVAANLMMQSGPENIVKFAKRLGVESPLKPVPALALGVNDISLFEMVSAYCTFVNGGTYIKPFALLRIEDKYGNVIEEFKPESKEVLSEKTAFYMVELLKAGSEIGTSKSLKTKFGINAEIGGKTGTTQNSADGWFIGISPELVTGVWVGGQTRNIRLKGGQGATLALPVWGYYMKSVLNNRSLEYDRAGYKWKETMIPVDCEANPNTDPPGNGINDFLEGI